MKQYICTRCGVPVAYNWNTYSWMHMGKAGCLGVPTPNRNVEDTLPQYLHHTRCLDERHHQPSIATRCALVPCHPQNQDGTYSQSIWWSPRCRAHLDPVAAIAMVHEWTSGVLQEYRNPIATEAALLAIEQVAAGS